MTKSFLLYVSFLLTFISLCLTRALKRRIDTLVNSLKGGSNCDFLSNVISVDTKNNNYDLLMSFSTADDCSYSCSISSAKGENINAILVNKEFFHEQHYKYLVFPGLKNYEKYTYVCSIVTSELKKFMSSEKSTEPVTGEIQFPKNPNFTNIITFGDWSNSDDGAYTKTYVKTKRPTTDALVFLGDQGYDLYQKEGKVGNDFLSFAKSITSRIPYQISTGNHEVQYNFEELKKRFIMPNKANSENLFYSYDINNAHFVAMNSEIPYQFDENYKLSFQNWLRNDLKSTTKKWKIVYLHRPLYCSMDNDSHCISSSKYMREILEEILIQNKVDLVLTGHVHAYERLFPIYAGQVDKESISLDSNTYSNPKFPVHVVCGAGGNREGFAKYKPKEFSYKVISKGGVCELNITGDEINFKFVGTKNSEVLDNFIILKR